MSRCSAAFFESSVSPTSELYNQQRIIFQRIWDLGFRYIRMKHWEINNIDDEKVIFLPGCVVGFLKEKELLLLKRWVKQGGNLILEAPPSPLSDLFKELIGIQKTTQRRELLPAKEGPLEIKSFWLRICRQHPMLRGYDLELSLNPIWGEVLLSEPLPSTEYIAEILDCDGTTVIGPGMLLNSYGKGRIISYLFTVGYTMLCGLQGRGCENLSIYDSRPGARTASFWEPQGKSEVIRAIDQLPAGTPTWKYPFSDFLLLPIINTFLERFPEMPVVYWIPEGKEAAVIHTADGDGATDNDQLAYLEEMQSRGLRTSIFFFADQEHDARRYVPWKKKTDLGLHFSPVQWSISEQAALMRNQGFLPRSARGHSLQWQGLTTTAEKLVEEGIAFDSTLGMPTNNFGGRHYFSTGTTVPYRFFNVNGKRINLLEIPLPFMEFFFDEFLSEIGDTDRIGAEHNSISDYYEAFKNYHAVFTVVFHPVHTHKTDRWQWFKKGLDHLMNQPGFHHNNMTGYGDWFTLRDKISIGFGQEQDEVILEAQAISGLSLLTLDSKYGSNTINMNQVGMIRLWGRNFRNNVADFPEGKHTLSLITK